jgi:hypothetical protein
VVIIEDTSALAWIKTQGKALGGDALSIRQAAQLAHVHQETIRYWKRTDPTFAAVLIQKNYRYIISKQCFFRWLKKRKRQSSNKKEGFEHAPVSSAISLRGACVVQDFSVAGLLFRACFNIFRTSSKKTSGNATLSEYLIENAGKTCTFIY